jgi:hypothetical protein
MSKNFKIARKPQTGEERAPEVTETVRAVVPDGRSATTRKTIEVPEEYFYQVKLLAVRRRMKEKDVWAEILREYFINHAAEVKASDGL